MPKVFRPGQPVLYQPTDHEGKIYKKEYGIVKRMNSDGSCAFVWFHSGCTAASTPIIDLIASPLLLGHVRCHKGCVECL